jgi:hypothetical protein
VIVITPEPGSCETSGGLRADAYDYLGKPINPAALRAALRRILETRRAARRLSQYEMRNRALLDAIPDTILRISRKGIVLDIHVPREDPPRWWPANLCGRSIARAGLPESLRDQLLATINRALTTETAQILEASSTTSSGPRSFELRVVKSGEDEVVTIVRDVTVTKQAADRSVQAERLAAIGQMVAGLAHESRNAFQRCQAFLEMLAMEVEDRPEALDLVERLQQTQHHLHYLYEEVRTYAAPIKLDLQPVDISQLWRATWRHLEAERGERAIALVEQLETANPLVYADPNALEQVFRNVLENAIDACPDPGEIVVRCRAVRWQRQAAIEVRIRDNGAGFLPEARQKAFEPFFTTKTKGTGLGMAIARRLVESHGGEIGVGDSRGTGGQIVIRLPCDAVGQ